MGNTNRLSITPRWNGNRLRLETAACTLRELDWTGSVGRHSQYLDYAQAVQERDNRFALSVAVNETRDEIERALARIAAGLYGRCEECSAVIARERLSVLPEATRCVSCQRAHELGLGRCA